VSSVFREVDGHLEWLEAGEFIERCAHALVTNGHVWLIDPFVSEGVDERIRAAGKPAGVIQLLDRHNRDCRSIAQRFGIEHHVVPREAVGPFEFISIRSGRTWQEVALWWPERRVLVCGDALGSAPYYRAGDERLAVHPFLRLRPPRKQLEAVDPVTILCGHGGGIRDEAGPALRDALKTARRRIPAQLASAVRAWRATPRS
jgi:hypothetical protein